VYLETSGTGTTFTYTGAGEKAGKPPTTGTKWLVKNLLELKNAQRVRIEGNVIENVWVAGQAGYALVFTPRNASGTAPWTAVRDVTITNNIIRHAGGVINIAGVDNTATTQRTDKITLRNNLFADIDTAKYGPSAKPILVGSGGPSNVVVDRNTFVHKAGGILHAYGSVKMPGFVFTNNNVQHFKYGIVGDGTSAGNATLTRYFTSPVVRCNVMAGGPAASYPTPNSFPSVSAWLASFVSPSTGDYSLRSGSVVANAVCGGVVPGANMTTLKTALSGGSTTTATTPAESPSTTNALPVAHAGGPYAAAVNALLVADGTASRDSDGTIVDYQWSWGDEVLVRAADVPASGIKGTEWARASASDASGGVLLKNPNRGAAKRSTAAAAPASYVEMKVYVAAGVPYHLWMRMRADGDSYANDSLFVQFSGALNAQRAPIAKIGTTSALAVVLEEGNGAGLAGWGWNDDTYGSVGGPIYFATSGLQTIRIQQREDGIMWDQLILSSGAYLTKAPGPTKGDATILDADFGASAGPAPSHRYVRPGVYPVVLRVTDDRGGRAAAATTATVK
jgi:hypothetical protein